MVQQKEVSCMQKQVQQQLPRSGAAVQSCDIPTHRHSHHCRNERTSHNGRYREIFCQVVFLFAEIMASGRIIAWKSTYCQDRSFVVERRSQLYFLRNASSSLVKKLTCFSLSLQQAGSLLMFYCGSCHSCSLPMFCYAFLSLLIFCGFQNHNSIFLGKQFQIMDLSTLVNSFQRKIRLCDNHTKP